MEDRYAVVDAFIKEHTPHIKALLESREREFCSAGSEAVDKSNLSLPLYLAALGLAYLSVNFSEGVFLKALFFAASVAWTVWAFVIRSNLKDSVGVLVFRDRLGRDVVKEYIDKQEEKELDALLSSYCPKPYYRMQPEEYLAEVSLEDRDAYREKKDEIKAKYFLIKSDFPYYKFHV